jgi:hypothetical protein
MADRRDYYFRQLVTEAELDAGFAGLETADENLAIDFAQVGVISGLTVAQEASPSMHVQVSGPGVAYDQAGERMSIATTQHVDCSVDEDGLTTTVVTPGNSKKLAVFLEFDRTLTDPRIDGNGETVYFVRSESFKLNVVQGAENVSPSLVPLRSDQILLADITIAYGATTIVTGNLSVTRRQDVVRTSGSPYAVIAGTGVGAAEAVLSALNDSWVKLGATTSSDDGAKRIGAQNNGLSLSTGTVRSQLDALDTGKLGLAGGTMTGNIVLATSGSVEVNYQAARSKVINIPMAAFKPCSTSGGLGEWYIDSSATPPTPTSRVASGFGLFDLSPFVKTGYVITLVRLVVNPSSAQSTAGNRMQFKLTREIPDFVTPNTPGEETVTGGSATDDGTTNLQVVTITPTGGLTIDLSLRTPFLKVKNNIDASGSTVHSLELTVTVPGPR